MKKYLLSSMLLLGSLCTQKAMAQAVVFPQQKQAGYAMVQADGDVYTLKNDLFEASFVRQGGTLKFNGSEALTLLPGTELFNLVLDDGTTYNASDMTLESVVTEDLAGDPTAVKGSEKVDGKAIKAVFTKDNLTVVWRAILRNGSHYLRTEIDLSSSTDQAMESLTPMIYGINTAVEGSNMEVVGNTRGAVLLSDKIFAGLETPMGVNSVVSDNSYDAEDFSPKSWTAESFSWLPGNDTPTAIIGMSVPDEGNATNSALSASEVCGTRGYVTFRKSGEQTITFAYASGSHRLNIVGVDVVDIATSSVVTSDYHYGWTGTAKENNVYTINVPKAGSYMLRYFMETHTETITSAGTITFSQPIAIPVVKYVTAGGATVKVSPRTLSTTLADATTEGQTIDFDGSFTQNWTQSWWTSVGDATLPESITELGYNQSNVFSHEQTLNVSTANGTLSTEFQYTSGNNRLQIVGVDLVSGSEVVASDYHFGYTGGAKDKNTYTFKVPQEGMFTLRYFVTNDGTGEGLNSAGTITTSYVATVDTVKITVSSEQSIQGYWRRKTTLKADNPWNVSAVVGLVAEGQARRSFLSYSERERAVPWRAMPVYISWYELNIDRNNAAAPSYSGNMTEAQCLDVLQHWNDDFYTKYNKTPKAFVWDDGWDEYGTWKFNCNFPNEFKNMDAKAQEMGSGIGAWLGPVGGYGTSGTYRRNYWTNKGGMQLSNDDYYKFFIDACNYMVDNYDFRFFKFDGISAQSSAVGPDNNDTGYNNAEAIISIERAVRKQRPDIFYNTTVGTWASPFWFHFSDAVWRQEGDYGETGQGTDREKWITYRDRLVYQNFVTNSPICPINTLMTHGFILSSHGQVSKDMTYAGVVRELRCAFACGSGMVELYNDYALMNSIKDDNGNAGALWGDLSECMDWQERNSDVLPDIHWVGGNPWNGRKASIYGWAAWNGEKCVLTLRNGGSYAQKLNTTLRELLDIPSFVKTTITLKSSFDDQTALTGLELDKAIDIDEELSITVPKYSVFVSEGIDNQPTEFKSFPTVGITEIQPAATKSEYIYDLSGRRLSAPQKGVNIIGNRKVIIK